MKGIEKIFTDGDVPQEKACCNHVVTNIDYGKQATERLRGL